MNRRSLTGNITLEGKHYHIVRELGKGGSCIAYRATTDNQPSPRDVVIKELYPAELADDLVFGYQSGFGIDEAHSKDFDIAKKRFLAAAKEQVAFYGDDCNHSIGVPEIYMGYNTVYSVLPITNGEVLSDALPQRQFWHIGGYSDDTLREQFVNVRKLSLCEIAQIMTSLCNAVGNLHKKGRLYLDIKPDNIFLFAPDKRETRRVALFDFDTVVANDSETLRFAYPFISDGWQSPELSSWKTNIISEKTDCYAIGAVFYWLMSGQLVSKPILDAIMTREYGNFGLNTLVEGKRNASRIAETILLATVRRSAADRVTSMEELREMFTELDKSSESATENKSISDKIDELAEMVNDGKTEPKMVMTQHGSNNMQIGSISGGSLNINFGSSNTAETKQRRN